MLIMSLGIINQLGKLVKIVANFLKGVLTLRVLSIWRNECNYILHAVLFARLLFNWWSWNILPFLEMFHVAFLSKIISIRLGLRQYKNGLVSVKNMFILKLPPFFPRLHGKGKRAAISKLACVSQKRIRSCIVLALAIIVDSR